MSHETDDPTLEAVRLLRESGYHEAAADLATKALQRATAAPPAETAAEKPAPAAPRTQAELDRQQGEYLLACLERDLGPRAA